MSMIAFIGLGNMGAPMVRSLVKAGHTVRAYDVHHEAVHQAAEAGAIPCHSSCGAVAGASVVISVLPSGAHVRDLYLGPKGILDKVSPDTLLVDCSTIDVPTAVAVSEAAESLGLEFVDAPVSGGVAGAMAATLTFICGGNEKGVGQARPLLMDMGDKVFHAGGHGSGQMAKICNTLLVSVSMIATCEALQLGRHHGLDPNVLSDIIKASSGDNWVLDKYNPCPGIQSDVPSSNNYLGGFSTDLMVKDLGLAMQAATLSGSATPLGSLAASLFRIHAAQGHGKSDFSSIFKQFDK